MVAGWRISIITILQLGRFSGKQGKWIEVAYMLPFSLRDMADLCPKGIDLDMKPSAPSYPPTLPPSPGLQTEQTESQGTPPGRVALVSVKAQTEIQSSEQPQRPHQQPIAYLSRELDVVSPGWPH